MSVWRKYGPLFVGRMKYAWQPALQTHRLKDNKNYSQFLRDDEATRDYDILEFIFNLSTNATVKQLAIFRTLNGLN